MTCVYRLLFLALLHTIQSYLGTCLMVVCKSPQYLNYGEMDTVDCVFHDEFLSVLWFDTIDYKQSEPILRYQDFTKVGTGYESGEYDISPNGSLIINHVLLRHDTTFTVMYVQTRQADVIILHIVVSVIVKPTEVFPHISHCGTSNTCFTEVALPSSQCSVSNARPNVTLRWLARTTDGDKNMTQDMSITSEGVGHTTRVTTMDVFLYSPLLVLLICKVTSPSSMLEKNQSVILAQNENVSIPFQMKQVLYIQQYTSLNLNCTDDDIGFFVWKKVVSQEKHHGIYHHILLYSILYGEEWTEIYENDVVLGSDASLTVPVADVGHEGLYYCIYGDGLKDGLTIYEVIVKVMPVPSHPVIEGCDHRQYCVLESDYGGSLTCKLKGIRPQVQLDWKTFLESDAHSISFTNQRVTVKENGETFDVTLTSTYLLTDRSRKKLTIECKIAKSDEKLFYSTTKLDLLFLEESFNSTRDPVLSTKTNIYIWIIITTLVLLLLFLLILGTAKRFCKRKLKTSGREPECTEEVSEMLPRDKSNIQSFTEIRGTFLRQIKEKYKDLYDAVQPIPYIKDRMYCVDKVFVESGIEVLIPAGGIHSEWKRVETYQNIFNDPRFKSARRIIEGEPGYGKSTLTLQLAYDWCTSSHESAMKDTDILIFLRLRQLGSVSSIYRAIKQFILPKDTTIDEKDIEDILKTFDSVVMILDGFDEYPNRDSSSTTDVINIIAREMFQEFEVVTTTRVSCLPKYYPPLTKRIRLTGFDKNSRRCYIRKAVVGEDNERISKIEQYLEQNPILRDLCQVPLLFVLFAHMTHESEHFRNLNSVTTFFRYMISCFHSHMRNKMSDVDVHQYKPFETDHSDLDRVAFEALSGKTQKLVWEKEELCKTLGQGFYDQYVRIGILVEEEVIDIVDDPGHAITEHIQYKTEVRFYHKIFCEWYAAHYLSNYLRQNPNVDLNDFLTHLDPFNVQYVYRFSCGLNTDAADKLLRYLKNIPGGDKFAILCILEQTGKFAQIEKSIRQLCDEGVIISGHDSLLLQRTSIQLLELAAKNDIPVKGVSLHNCFQSVDLSQAAIKISSGLVLTSRIAITELAVQVYNREVTKDEFVAVLEFSSMCPTLKLLRLSGSPPPRVFTVKSSLSALHLRNVKVLWQLFQKKPWYVLNLQTGQWQSRDDEKQPTSADFEQMRSEFDSVLKKK